MTRIGLGRKPLALALVGFPPRNRLKQEQLLGLFGLDHLLGLQEFTFGPLAPVRVLGLLPPSDFEVAISALPHRRTRGGGLFTSTEAYRRKELVEEFYQDVSRLGPQDWFSFVSLSNRELEVLSFLCQTGGGNKEMGEVLFISVKTAKKHISSILGKLGVASRTQAVSWLADRGLLDQYGKLALTSWDQ